MFDMHLYDIFQKATANRTFTYNAFLCRLALLYSKTDEKEVKT